MRKHTSPTLKKKHSVRIIWGAGNCDHLSRYGKVAIYHYGGGMLQMDTVLRPTLSLYSKKAAVLKLRRLVHLEMDVLIADICVCVGANQLKKDR